MMAIYAKVAQKFYPNDKCEPHNDTRGSQGITKDNRIKLLGNKTFIQRLFVCLGLKQSAITANHWQSNAVIQRSQEVLVKNKNSE